MTPFEVLYGKIPQTIQSNHLGFSYIEVVDTELITREELLLRLKQDLLKAQKRIK